MLDNNGPKEKMDQQNESEAVQGYYQQPAEPAAAADPALELPEIPAAAPQPQPPYYMYPPQFAQQQQPPRRSGFLTFVAAIALVAVGAGIGAGTTWGLNRYMGQNNDPIGYSFMQSSGVKAISQTTPEVGASVIPGIYRKVGPAVVKIDTVARRGSQTGSGTGSGVVVDARGYILTNHHVIDGATDISVEFIDGTTLPGKVMGFDRYKDLAVVKVDPGGRSLVAAPLGDSEAVEVGELAIAIGSPFDQSFTVTAGIVSAINREVQEGDSLYTIRGVIQTDASINPGNSGGPLLNANGEVIGINTLIETGGTGLRANVGIGFAVPISAAKAILPKMIAGEDIQYPWLGVTLYPVDKDLANEFKLAVSEGAMIGSVTKGTPAEKAGLKPATIRRQAIAEVGDIVVEVDGKPVKNDEDLRQYILTKQVGDKINLIVARGKERVTVPVTLEARPTTIQ